MWYDENEIKTAMKKWLNKKGFSINVEKNDMTHGVDIQKRSKMGCRYWFIEAKGYPSKTYKKGKKTGREKSQSSIKAQRYSWFTTVIGQIALRMKQKNGKYGIAFPYIDYFKDKILDQNKMENKERHTHIKLFRKRTKLHFFLIDKQKKIHHLTPTAKKFKVEKTC